MLLAPIIPGISDTEIGPIRDASARVEGGVGYMLFRLPREIKDLIAEWLEWYFTDRARQPLSSIRQTYVGVLYRSARGERRPRKGPYADLICQRVNKAKRPLGLRRDLGEFVLDYTKF